MRADPVASAFLVAVGALLLLARHRSRTRSSEPYTILLSLAHSVWRGSGRGVPAAAVSVSLSAAHDRVPHESDACIDARWEEKKRSSAKLFDMSKFRLRSASWDSNGRTVRLELGLTGYKEYVGTNQLPQRERLALEAAGAYSHGDKRAHLSNALGCETLLVTSDEMVVLLRRSARVAYHSGQYNGPSGHAEPSHAEVDSHPPVDRRADGEARARAELFASVAAEVWCETAVPKQSLSAPELIGVMEDAGRKPDLLFLTRTSLDAAAVRDAYSRGAEEGWESDRLAFWPVADLPRCEHMLPLSAVTRAAIACYREVQPQAAA